MTEAPRPAAWALVLHDLLPQTQCTRCGYPDCAAYAQAMAEDGANINRCPPGGAEGIRRLAARTGRPALPVAEACGKEGPRHVAIIDESWCIGCTLCIEACPVDAIVGTHKFMHTVVEAQCTGCELCVPVCPVDCIELENVSGERTGWAAWSKEQASQALARYQARSHRQALERQEHARQLEEKALAKLADLDGQTQGATGAEASRKRSVIEAALARARSRRT